MASSNIQLQQPGLSTPAFGVPSSLGTRPRLDWSKSTASSSISRHGDSAEHATTSKEGLSITFRLGAPSSFLPVSWTPETLRGALSWAKQKVKITKHVIAGWMKGREQGESGIEAAGNADVVSGIEVFRFLDLPPELRLWVYRSALVPSGIVHRPPSQVNFYFANRAQSTLPYAIGLLASCKQIKNEIDDMLYAENTFYIDVNNLDSSRFPVIMRSEFTEETWPLLQHVVLTLNAAHPGGHSAWGEAYSLCDWRQLQHFTGLKSARIIIITIEDLTDDYAYEMLLTHVLERLPAGCAIEFGPKTELDHMHAQGLVCLAEIQRSSSRFNRGETVVAESATLGKVAEGMTIEKGCISGSDKDYRGFSAQIEEINE